MRKNEVKFLSVGRSKYYGLEEQGIWALLLVVAVIQIACAFSAGGDMVNAKEQAVASVPMHDGTLLAKR